MKRDAVIMIVDDEPDIRDVLDKSLTQEGYEIISAASAAEAIAKLEQRVPDLLITDLSMPEINGIELLERVRQLDPSLPVLAISGCASVKDAVQALKRGAFDIVEKPLRLDRFHQIIQQALETQVLRRDILRLRHEQSSAHNDLGVTMIGESEKMKAVGRAIRRVGRAPSTTVLIEGETGAGKELVARAIHRVSARRDQPFVEVNCAALTETLLEAELFGYEKGAFTGAATAGKPGLFEMADGGTIFLDEIGEMSQHLQAKLLRALQEKRYKRVGGTDDVSVNIRVIASTNRDLVAAVEKNQFRADLYYRLAVVTIAVPPLRERRDDIPILANHFLAGFNAEFGKQAAGFSDEALRQLRQHDWPGNVRELKNCIERSVLLQSGNLIGPQDLLFGDHRRPVRKKTVEFDLEDLSLAALERQLIRKVLEQTAWKRQEAANILGINRTTLYNKIREYSLDPPGDAAQFAESREETAAGAL